MGCSQGAPSSATFVVSPEALLLFESPLKFIGLGHFITREGGVFLL